MRKKNFKLSSLWFVILAFGFALPLATLGGELHPYLQHSKWGFIDETGKIIVSAQYQNYGKLSEGLIAVHNGQKWGFIDTTGKVVIDFQFEDPQNIAPYNPKFSEGLACVQVAGDDGWNRFGYIDKSGKFRIQPKYKHAFNFSDGLAFVLVGLKYGYINKSGSLVIKPKSYHLDDGFSEGLATIAITNENSTDKWGFIDTTGKIAIQPQFDWASDFYEGRAAVKIKDKLGFIDKTGKIVVQPVYDQVGSFSDGLAPVAVSDTPLNPRDIFLNGKWGYIDKFGSIVIPLRFFKATQFSEGLACVNFEELTIPGSNTSGFIDQTGKVIIEPQFTTCTEFERGIAEVGFRGGSGLIDKTGKIIWKATYEEMHSPKK